MPIGIQAGAGPVPRVGGLSYLASPAQCGERYPSEACPRRGAECPPAAPGSPRDGFGGQDDGSNSRAAYVSRSAPRTKRIRLPARVAGARGPRILGPAPPYLRGAGR